MAGESIAQARKALKSILDRLTPEDRIAMIGFGSTIREWSDELEVCDQTGLTGARQFTRGLEADLGGTEIGPAVARASELLDDVEGGHILLITDGEISDWQAIISQARGTGQRSFTVGVGSAVSATFLRDLSYATSGACELTAPGEDIALPVMRQFNRMRASRSRRRESGISLIDRREQR